MNPWPHQLFGVSSTLAAIARGERRVLLTSPTGGGKTWMVQQLARHFLERGKRVVLYSNRKFLIEQLGNDLANAGMTHGCRAAGSEDLEGHPFQIASMATENSRVLKRKQMDLHAAGPGDLALIDEGHLHNNATGREIIRRHVAGGAAVVLVTATPVGMAEVADVLIQAGITSELRACGALVPALHYAPDEPDLRKLKAAREGDDLSERQQREAIMRPGIFGRIWKAFETFNPAHKPTMVFGPDVHGSLWIVEQFVKKGVPAAHVDGEHIWKDGRLWPTCETLREEVRDASRSGDLVVVSNRFVLREGANWPWLAHGVFATVFGSIQSYLQAGGRLLRSHPGLQHVTIQDHGGNWWRHGSLNADREWRLDYTAAVVSGLRADRLRNNPARQPFRCPRCERVWTSGRICHPVHGGCGFELPPAVKLSRPVVAMDGTLKEMTGDIFKPRRISMRPDGPAKWERMYWRSRTAKGSRTFRAAMALFAQENYWQWPDPSWPFMPTEEIDFFRLVGDVPVERLVPQEAHA